MVNSTLPCAEKKCKSKMALTDKTDEILYYNCLEKHDEHVFKYNISQKKWEKITIKSRIILNYKENPCKDNTQTNNIKEKKIINDVQEPENSSNLIEISGIGSKRAKELESVGIKTISDLAKCSPADLSEKTGISIVQISNWIIESNNLKRKAELITA